MFTLRRSQVRLKPSNSAKRFAKRFQRGGTAPMARPRNTVPAYRKHKQTGRAAVSIYRTDGSRTEVILLGRYGSAESKQEYERLLCQLRANEGKLPVAGPAKDITIAELVVRFMAHAETYYVDAVSHATTEQSAIKEAVRPLVRLYGHLPVNEFDSLCLESVQSAMATDSTLTEEERKKKIKRNRPLGLARTTINRHIDRIKRLMRWGCAKKIVPANNLVNIEAVASLKAGRCNARETEIVKPVDPAIVEKTLPFMAPTPADMVRLMLLSGCRVGELCRLTGRELDRSGSVWVYTPTHHKTQARGHVRNIAFGPQAMLILRKYIKADPDAFLFSPAEQDRFIKEQMRAARKSRVQPSQRDRSRPNAKRKPGECYTPQAVNHAIKRGCKKAGVIAWHTHRLRHTAALEILREFGHEAARSALGHRTLNMTLHYSGIDLERAKEVAQRVG
jgi:integrase